MGRGAQGAVYASTAGLDVLVHVTQHQITGWDRSWSPRSRPVHQIRIRPSQWPREHPGPRGPTSRQQYAAGSAAPETTTILLDRLYDRNISNVRDGTGSEASPHGRTSLLASHGAVGHICKYMYYLSRTPSWVKPTIWLPSPPIGLIIHKGFQLHGEPRGIC